jgi:deoxyribonuclease V
VAGADVAYPRLSRRTYAAVVVLALPSLDVVEVTEAACRARFPYIPGLLTFREVPPLLKAFARLRSEPDALLFDGQGLAHPRRFGLGCHAGLLLGTPSAPEHPQVLPPAAHGRLMRPGHRARRQAWALIRGL